MERYAKENIMLAVIIPYYKLTFFDETLDSLSKQTDKRFKVYIGDDASIERPNCLLDRYKGKFDLTYHRFEENLGSISLTKQWERCIALSHDEPWIMLLGDDDYLEDNVVEYFYKNLDNFKNRTNVIRLASKVYNQDKKEFTKIYTHPIWEKASDSYFRKFQFLTISSLSEYIFRRESYLNYKFNDFPLAWYADDMAWIEFSGNSKIFSINEAVVVFRFSNLNISGMQTNLEAKDRAKFLFFEKLIRAHVLQFTHFQKQKLILEFGITAIAQQRLNFELFFLIIQKLVQNGSFYALAKFIRRVIIAKFKKRQ